jgi:hypothetical protein
MVLDYLYKQHRMSNFESVTNTNIIVRDPPNKNVHIP